MSSVRSPLGKRSRNQAQKQVILIASGDLRASANEVCWDAQRQMESDLEKSVAQCGYKLHRAHQPRPGERHGFIDSQKQGLDVFARIDPDSPLIVAEAVWQYSHHVLAGLTTHRGPILTVANWSGQWPGLVGMLNLNGSLTKAGVRFSTLWAEDFDDPKFIARLDKWLATGKIRHTMSHVQPIKKVTIPTKCLELGQSLAEEMKTRKSIMGVFDEGCMGMFNAILPDHLLNQTGVFKERLSQSALYYESQQVSASEANQVRQWMEDKGMTFETGKQHAKHLTDQQILEQCKMYIAAVRIADDFGCDTIGIQYQQGLKDLMPASDLVEGTLNNKSRPPVTSRDGKRVLYRGQPLPHFNEVDECAGLDGLMTNRIHRALKQPTENTLHDIRWGDWDQSGTTDEYVWVFLISGSVPPAHLIGGWKGATSYRQPVMYFPNGGGTIQGTSKPGEIIWSRIFVANNRLNIDLGRAKVVKLPEAETRRRLESTTPQWPIMHAVTYGVSRDQMMARHQSNHIQVAYAKSSEAADEAVFVKAAMAERLGMVVNFCGTRANGDSWS